MTTFNPNCNFYRLAPTMVFDGDTIEADIELEHFNTTIRRRIQLFDVDLPDRGGEDFSFYGSELANWLTRSADAGPVTLDVHGVDSFGRLIGTIYNHEGATVNAFMQQLKATRVPNQSKP